MSRRRCLAACLAAMLTASPWAPARAQQTGGAPEQSEAAVGQSILDGYRRYNGACSHCHGPDGVGSTFAPSLIEDPLPFARFEEVVAQGSTTGTSVMRGFADDPNVAPYVRDIWLYLEARAEGSLSRGRPTLAP